MCSLLPLMPPEYDTRYNLPQDIMSNTNSLLPLEWCPCPENTVFPVIMISVFVAFINLPCCVIFQICAAQNGKWYFMITNSNNRCILCIKCAQTTDKSDVSRHSLVLPQTSLCQCLLSHLRAWQCSGAATEVPAPTRSPRHPRTLRNDPSSLSSGATLWWAQSTPCPQTQCTPCS